MAIAFLVVAFFIHTQTTMCKKEKGTWKSADGKLIEFTREVLALETNDDLSSGRLLRGDRPSYAKFSFTQARKAFSAPISST